jgi:hypothetical protein
LNLTESLPTHGSSIIIDRKPPQSNNMTCTGYFTEAKASVKQTRLSYIACQVTTASRRSITHSLSTYK